MASDESFSKTGIPLPPSKDDNQNDDMGLLTHSIVEDVLYNIIHGIVLKTHREEKIARANSAAIIVSQKAAKLEARSKSNSGSSAQAPLRTSTDSAIYDDSKITITGNPLQTLPAKELRCPKCALPRLLNPTIGSSSDSKIKYCTKHPFVDKPGHDIYGQSFPIEATGPGKGKKKSKIIDGTDTPEESTAAASPPPSSQQNIFPNVKCPSCARSLAIKRFADHLSKCIGPKGRPSGRAAQLKMNGNSQNSNNSNSISTPPGSRRGTPVPSKKNGISKNSPQKRDRPDPDEYDENEDSEDEPKKKKRKVPIKKKEKVMGGVTKKWKSGRQTVDGKIKLNLNLSFAGTTSSSRATSDAEAEEGEKLLKPAVEKPESVSSMTE